MWVLLEIDVDGAQRVLEKRPDALTLFVTPASDPAEARRVLEQRLRGRGTEDDQSLGRRLEVARHELERAPLYRHTIVNDGLEAAVDQIHNLLINEGLGA